jgi:RHS repeat-associated protein
MISNSILSPLTRLLSLAGILIQLSASAQVTFFTDQCNDPTAWTLGAGAPGASYGEYTAWKMGNVGANIIDGSTLAINSWNRLNGGYWWDEYIENSAADIVAKRTINATGYQTLQLTFDWLCLGENVGASIRDYGQVGYSTNNGVSFTWLPTGGTTNNGMYYGTSSIIRNQTITLPAALNNTSFVIGFHWVNDAANGGFPGFTVDNIRISGTFIAGGTPESSKVTVFQDECKNDQGWTLGKGPWFDGTTYTAWRIANDSLCSIDYGTLSIESWNEHSDGKWNCGYLDFQPCDVVAYKKVDARDYENMELQFDWSGIGEHNPYYLFDYGQVGYSLDNGANFTWLTVGGGDSQGKYFGVPSIVRGEKLNMPAALNGKEFLLAFHWMNDYSIEGIPGFMVDNIKITGSVKAKQLSTIFKDNLDAPGVWQLNKAPVNSAGNTLAWNIDRRCSIDGNSLSINLYNNTTKQWDCGFATNAAADIIASRFISAISARNLFLKFDWKVTSTTTTDYAQIGYSIDGGLSYTWLNYGGTANGKYYNQATLIKSAMVKLPAVLEGKEFKLGIRWVNDASINSGQAMLLDNISVIAETGLPPLPEQPKVNRITDEYVKLIGKKTEADVNALTEDGKIVEKAYFDGMERKIQQVLWKASPSKNDVVNVTLYDENGNAGTSYLPYKSATNDAGYHPDMLNEQYTYNNTAKANFVATEYAYSQTLTEASPANRIKEAGSGGKEFQPGLPGTTRTVSQKFLTAQDNNPPTIVEAIKLIKLVDGPSLSVNYYSAPSEPLLVTEVVDEDKKMKRTYTNNKGQVILERRYATNGTTILTQTYYVYDEFDRLRVTIQPQGLVAGAISAIPSSLSSTYLDTYCFQYNYDERGRLISKRAPGGGWIEIAYDRWDRPVITQDANQKAKSPQEFTYVKYDFLNRVISTGTFKAANRTLNMASVKTELENTALGERFETRTLGTLPNRDFTNNLSYPKADATNTLTPLAQTYYDDYSYTDLSGFAFTPALSYTASNVLTATRGKVTAVRSNVLGTSTWLSTVNYYDVYDRVIQTQQVNINGIKNFLTTEYDFQGRVTKTLEDNKLTASVGVLSQHTNQYDHLGRITRVLHKTNALTEVVHADYKYTDLGTRISEKNLYSTNGGTSYLQSVDYTYNEKGWLININKADLSNGGDYNNDANDVFGMEFKYYKNQAIDNTKAQYNGNISEVIWKSTASTSQYGYLYSYDDVNRLTAASYRNLSNSAENNRFSMGSITYDANGNIKNLQQNGILTGTSQANFTYGLMDNLTYNYNGNRLSTITDAVGTTAYASDFQNGSNPVIETDYMYDENGNLIMDDNKAISGITYNVLNLPVQITTSNGRKTVFTYDALGNKLRKQEYNGATLTLTNDYIGSVQYLNGAVQFAVTPEGRVYNNSGTYRYDYFMKDQTGNIRMTFTANGSAVQVLQTDDYYPFGNTFNSTLAAGGKNNYLFNGMDFNENTLGTYDFHARMYDPQIGRSFQLDPMGDVFASLSPYSFLMNNPVMYTDPTGMVAEPADDLGDGDGTFGPIGPSTVLGIGSWFQNSGKSYRGAGGFLAAFNPRARFLQERARNEYSRLKWLTLVEKYTDTYTYNQYENRLTYQYSKLESSYWELSSASNFNGWFGIGMGALQEFTLSGQGLYRTSKGLIRPIDFAKLTAHSRLYAEYAQFLKTLGHASALVSIGFDFIAWHNKQISNAKFGLNTGVAAWGLGLGYSGMGIGATIGGAFYFIFDSYYPGGWDGAMKDQEYLNQLNTRINPDWQLWPKALKQ